MDDQRAKKCKREGAQQIKNLSDHQNKRQKEEEAIKVTRIWGRARSAAAKTLNEKKSMRKSILR